MQPNQGRYKLQAHLSSLAEHSSRHVLRLCLVFTPSVDGLQAEFNTSFKAAQSSRQAEVDRILDANNRMTEIWEEQAQVGSGSGAGSGAGEEALFHPRGALDDTEGSVLSVNVNTLSSFTPPLLPPPPTPKPPQLWPPIVSAPIPTIPFPPLPKV